MTFVVAVILATVLIKQHYVLDVFAGIVLAAERGESYKDLLYVRHRFISKEHLRATITQVANATFRARALQIWGEATTACASDSMRREVGGVGDALIGLGIMLMLIGLWRWLFQDRRG